jgi:hypothetical protein
MGQVRMPPLTTSLLDGPRNGVPPGCYTANLAEHKKPHGRAFYVDKSMVRERVFRWNSLCQNLLQLGKELSDLGLIYSDGKVIYLLDDTAGRDL